MLTKEELETVDKYMEDKSHGRDWYNNETYYPEDIDKLLAIIDRLTKPETVLAETERLLREASEDGSCDVQIRGKVFVCPNPYDPACEDADGMTLPEAYEALGERKAEEARKADRDA